MKRLFLLLITFILIIQVPCFCNIQESSTNIENFNYEFTEKNTYKKVEKSIIEYNIKSNMENLPTIKIEKETILKDNKSNTIKDGDIYINSLTDNKKEVKILIGKYTTDGITIYTSELINAINILGSHNLVKNFQDLYLILIDNNIKVKKINEFINKLSNTNVKISDLLLPIIFTDIQVNLYQPYKIENPTLFFSIVFIFIILLITIITLLILKKNKIKQKN